jgi:hypothetical protein
MPPDPPCPSRGRADRILVIGRAGATALLFTGRRIGGIMSLEKADAFASSLDREDFDAARTFLDDHCVYYMRDRCISGKDEIIAAYREENRWAKKYMDIVNYCHGLQRLDFRDFLIVFIDAIRHKGKAYVHKSRQKISFNDAEKIDLIIHYDIAGEKEKLERFNREQGMLEQP